MLSYNPSKVTLILILLISSFLISCGGARESDSLKTKNIKPHITLRVGESANAYLTVELKKRRDLFGPNVILTGNDSLSFTFLGVTEPLIAADIGDSHMYYYAYLQHHDLEENVTVTLDRGEKGSVSTTNRIPEPFNITQPQVNDRYYEGENLQVYWDNAQAGDDIELSWEISCPTSRSRRQASASNLVNDSGSYSLELRQILDEVRDQLDTESNEVIDTSELACSQRVSLSRSNERKDLSGFASGSYFKIAQRRSVSDIQVFE